MMQNKSEVRAFLEPVQLGMSLGGVALFTRLVEGVLQVHPEFIAWKLDLKNAFNEEARRSVLEVLEATPSLAHLVSFAATILAPVCALEAGGKTWGWAAEGLVQGDTSSGDFFTIALQPDLVALDMACRQGGGLARAGHDDVVAQGPPAVVIPAVLEFMIKIKSRCGLQVQLSKSQIFSWDGLLPAEAPQDVELAGKMVDGNFEVGFNCYGVPMGTPAYRTSELREKAEVIVADAEKVEDLLCGEKQAMWSALRLSIYQRFGYFSQHVPPSLTEPGSLAGHQTMAGTGVFSGIQHPKRKEGRGRRSGGESTSNSSRRKIFPRLGCKAASEELWVGLQVPGAVLWSSLPWGPGDFNPQDGRDLPPACGSLEWRRVLASWGSGSAKERRWRKVLLSGTQEGEELRRTWTSLTNEAREAAEWLDKDLEPVFSSTVEGVGNGSVTGETRRSVVEALEKTRALLLGKGLRSSPAQECQASLGVEAEM